MTHPPWRIRTRHARLAAILAALVAGDARCEAAVASVCHPQVEVSPDGTAIRVRPHATALLDCTLDEAGYTARLGTWFASAPAAARIRTIALGRAVNHPWIARAIVAGAARDPRWDPRTGRPRSGHANGYVAALLAAPDLRARLAAPLAGTGVGVVGVSVEKVLVAPAAAMDRDLARFAGQDQRLPFDAQVWLRLAPVQ